MAAGAIIMPSQPGRWNSFGHRSKSHGQFRHYKFRNHLERRGRRPSGPPMKYSLEHHLAAARDYDRQANSETDPKRRAILREAARRRRIVVRVARLSEARKLTREALTKASQGASRKDDVHFR
jgi:hypothetical protein